MVIKICRYLRALSPKTEFVIILLVAFGPFVVGSLLSLLPHADAPAITEQHQYSLIVHEAVVFIILWSFLGIRGWNFDHIGLGRLVWSDLAVSIGMVVATYFISACLFYGLWLVAPAAVWNFIYPSPLVAHDAKLATVIMLSLLNPVFEEVFVCGYIQTVLKSRDRVWLGLNLSVAIRLAYHLYQGVMGILTIVPLGLIFSFWFMRRGRLWPVIIAHGLMDFVGLMQFVI